MTDLDLVVLEIYRYRLEIRRLCRAGWESHEYHMRCHLRLRDLINQARELYKIGGNKVED